MTDDLAILAAEAYVYGYPLVSDIQAVLACTEKGMGSVPATPFNEFRHGSTLGGPDAKFVSVNNDTIYSIAVLDLSGGPLLLDVPDTHGAYDVLQFVDAWTNNFAYIGRRATGTQEQHYLLAPPGWTGQAPPGTVTVTVPTQIATIVGRLACDGPEDLPRVEALQRQLILRPLAGSGSGVTVAGVPVAGQGLPEVATDEGGIPGDVRFFDQLRVWLAAFPPAGPDREYQARFAPLGLLVEGTSPYLKVDLNLAAALSTGIKEGRHRIEAASMQGHGRSVNGWHLGLHTFDYNVDYFELGALDNPQWKIADRTVGYLARACAARVGLWGNHAYEAVYCQIYQDNTGERLTGSRSYSLHFDQPPPVDGFWSLTMYDVPNYWMVDNPINRYSIGDRTPGLRYADDGSLTIVMSHDRPAEADVPNWLPAPAGEFRPILRMYQPQPAVVDGTYKLPPIRPTGTGT